MLGARCGCGAGQLYRCGCGWRLRPGLGLLVCGYTVVGLGAVATAMAGVGLRTTRHRKKGGRRRRETQSEKVQQHARESSASFERDSLAEREDERAWPQPAWPFVRTPAVIEVMCGSVILQYVISMCGFGALHTMLYLSRTSSSLFRSVSSPLRLDPSITNTALCERAALCERGRPPHSGDIVEI